MGVEGRSVLGGVGVGLCDRCLDIPFSPRSRASTESQ